MSIKQWNLLLVFGLLVFLATGSGILYQNHVKTQAALAQAEAELNAQRKAERAALKQSFQTFNNEFLNTMNNEMVEYKKRRRVLKELLDPANLTTPAYIKENAHLAESQILALSIQMEDILKAFERASHDIAVLSTQFKDENARQEIQETWQQVRDKNVEKFTKFFTSERRILQAQLALMQFYNAHRQTLKVDILNERVIFETAQQQEQAAMLRSNISRLKTTKKKP